MSIEKLMKFNILDKISIANQDKNDFDEVLISEESIFIIKRYSNKYEFEKEWKETVHFTAGYIQNNLDKLGFEEEVAWDIYIFYIINFDIDISFINVIERDKYCCKKYVINTNGFEDENKAISSRIPLFASFKDIMIDYRSSFSDKYIKEKITEGNNSIVARYFKELDFAENSFEFNGLLERLEELHRNEQN